MWSFDDDSGRLIREVYGMILKINLRIIFHKLVEVFVGIANEKVFIIEAYSPTAGTVRNTEIRPMGKNIWITIFHRVGKRRAYNDALLRFTSMK